MDIRSRSRAHNLFIPLEHAVLAREVIDIERTKMFARYSLVGALAASLGALAAATPDLLASVGLDQLTAIKMMFVLYALLGIVGGLFYARIPRRRRGAVRTPIRASSSVRSAGPATGRTSAPLRREQMQTFLHLVDSEPRREEKYGLPYPMGEDR